MAFDPTLGLSDTKLVSSDALAQTLLPVATQGLPSDAAHAAHGVPPAREGLARRLPQP